MRKHAKDQSTVETDFEAAQKGIEFDLQWQESYDRAETKKDNNEYPYDLPGALRDRP